MKHFLKYLGCPLFICLLDFLAVILLTESLYSFDWLLSIRSYLIPIILAIINYILIHVTYKDDKLRNRILCILCIFIIVVLSFICADSFICGDDGFAIYEISLLIINSLVILLISVLLFGIFKKVRNK